MTYEDYAQMIADDVVEMETAVLDGLSEDDMHETTFNADVFEASRMDGVDPVWWTPDP